MAIIATGSTFTPCPAGLHQACCVDVVDLGVIETTYMGETKKQHKVTLVFQVAELMEDGRPYLAQRRYTLSLDAKANLRKDLESWRGKPFTPEQLRGFDLETLIGVNCQINVQHADRDGQTYANITAIVPLGRGMAKIAPVEYVRKKDRDPKPAPVEMPNGDEVFEGQDESVPF